MAIITQVLGGLAMLAGVIDPMEGAVLILPGSAFLAFGIYLGGVSARLLIYRLVVFGLIAMGVAALFILSSMGGIGGVSGHSMWWGVLILPYLAGWSMGIWGPGSPRWLVWLGLAAGFWCLVITTMVLRGHGTFSVLVGAVMGATGLLTIAGCLIRLCFRGKRAAV